MASRANLKDYVAAAKLAEDGLLDLVLVADVAPSALESVTTLSRGAGYDNLEPLTVVSALAATTKNIGLVPTLSTTYNEPFHVARKVASLDHLSSGRAGWNIVTTTNESDALNFNRDRHVEHYLRYERAEEFVDVVCGLWNSWDRDAFIRDKTSGFYWRPEGLHVLNHKGKHFSVRGPLNVIPTPQKRPVLVQAGASEPGQKLGARVADVIFGTQQSIDGGKNFCSALRSRAVSFGRDPNEVVVIMALVPYIGGTDSEAKRKFDYMQSLVDPVVALEQLAVFLNVETSDLDKLPLDRPLPEVLPPAANTRMQSRRAQILALSKRENLNLGELAARVAGTRGHNTVVGTANTIADTMEAWFKSGAADGFLIVPPLVPESLQEFIESVVPELQRRSLFRRSYEGGTLRENLGLSN